VGGVLQLQVRFYSRWHTGCSGCGGLGDAALCDLGCLCSVGSERQSMPVTGNVCSNCLGNILKSQANAVHFRITTTGVWSMDDQFLNSHSKCVHSNYIDC